MHIATELHAAVDSAISRDADSGHRKHLGASLIGEDCARSIWYKFRWTLLETFSPRMLRLFNQGHRLELRFVGWLRAAGVTVFDAGEDGEHKEALRIKDHEGHFGGTPDGIGTNIPSALFPLTEFVLLEFKSHNDKSFKKLISDGLMASKYRHWVQMQTYMHYHRLTWGLYCAMNKDNDEVRFEFIHADETVGQRNKDRAGAIIWADAPPPRIGKNPAHYGCKFCHLNRLCYFGDVTPDRNCRSCQWSAPIPGGLWTCKLRSVNLDEAAQRAGCDRYSINPQLHQAS